MSYCTQICDKINSLELKDGRIPARGDLIAHLPATDQNVGWPLGTWEDLQQRTSCGFCQLVVLAVLDNVPQGDVDIAPSQTINVLMFQDELAFRPSYPSAIGTQIAFITEESENALAPEFARPLSGTKIDSSKIKTWLQRCDTEHTCYEPPDEHAPEPKRSPLSDFNAERFHFDERLTSNFRVIDLELGCVKHVSLDTRYISLSYIWGQLPMFRLQKDNHEMMLQEGSLKTIHNDLPKTIQDAIKLVKAIGERYLWIDGLCLVQDDPDDMALGIGMMTSIYRGSYLTISAASGIDAHAGLPGFEEPLAYERTQRTKEVAPSIHMTIIHGIDWHLSRSTYNTRGWTLQELVLPHRSLIFLNNQIYFRCQAANWSEETWADKWSRVLDDDDSNISRITDATDGFLPSLWAYQKLNEDFSGRKLRSDGDSLRAFAGILGPMAAGMDSTIVEGLPGYYLDHFILFISSDGDMRRRDRFASFSWAGWEGRIMWPREHFETYEKNKHGRWKRTYAVENIFKHLRHNRLMEWEALKLSAMGVSLTYRGHPLPSLIFELMQEFPSVFNAEARRIDPVQDHDSIHRRAGRLYARGSSSSSGIPHWDRIKTDELPAFGDYYERTVEQDLTGPMVGFQQRILNAVNSQAEFDKVVKGMTRIEDRLSLINWMVCYRLRSNESKGRLEPPISRSRMQKQKHTPFREERSVELAKSQDRRRETGLMWVGKLQKNGRQMPFTEGTAAHFPPYTVLRCTTISLFLKLGKPLPSLRQQFLGPSHKPNTSFDRIQGIPLLSITDTLVGSLHPDNVSLLHAPGTAIELLIMTRSQTPTDRSALWYDESRSSSQAYRTSDEEGTEHDMAQQHYVREHGEHPWKLFWCMYVVWDKGIAERRGIAQITAEALEQSVGEVEVKAALIG